MWSKEIIRILNFDSIGKVTRLNLLGLEKIKFEDQNEFSWTMPMPLQISGYRNERMKTKEQRDKSAS